eukprot:jgi/Chlat1/1217/Chrsp115S01677
MVVQGCIVASVDAKLNMGPQEDSFVTVVSLGQAYVKSGPLNRKYWTKFRASQKKEIVFHPWPIGYRALVWTSGQVFTASIEEGLSGPKFVVRNAAGASFEGSSVSSAWTRALQGKTVNGEQARKLFGLYNHNTLEYITKCADINDAPSTSGRTLDVVQSTAERKLEAWTQLAPLINKLRPAQQSSLMLVATSTSAPGTSDDNQACNKGRAVDRTDNPSASSPMRDNAYRPAGSGETTCAQASGVQQEQVVCERGCFEGQLPSPEVESMDCSEPAHRQLVPCAPRASNDTVPDSQVSSPTVSKRVVTNCSVFADADKHRNQSRMSGKGTLSVDSPHPAHSNQDVTMRPGTRSVCSDGSEDFQDLEDDGPDSQFYLEHDLRERLGVMHHQPVGSDWVELQTAAPLRQFPSKQPAEPGAQLEPVLQRGSATTPASSPPASIGRTRPHSSEAELGEADLLHDKPLGTDHRRPLTAMTEAQEFAIPESPYVVYQASPTKAEPAIAAAGSRSHAAFQPCSPWGCPESDYVKPFAERLLEASAQDLEPSYGTVPETQQPSSGQAPSCLLGQRNTCPAASQGALLHTSKSTEQGTANDVVAETQEAGLFRSLQCPEKTSDVDMPTMKQNDVVGDASETHLSGSMLQEHSTDITPGKEVAQRQDKCIVLQHPSPVQWLLLASSMGAHRLLVCVRAQLPRLELRTCFLWKLPQSMQTLEPCLVGAGDMAYQPTLASEHVTKVVSHEANGACFTPDGHRLVLAPHFKLPHHSGKRGVLLVSLTLTGMTVDATLSASIPVHSLLVPDEQHLVAGGDAGTIAVWTMDGFWTESTCHQLLPAAALHKQPFTAIVSLAKGSIAIWDYQQCSLLVTCHALQYRILALQVVNQATLIKDLQRSLQCPEEPPLLLLVTAIERNSTMASAAHCHLAFIHDDSEISISKPVIDSSVHAAACHQEFGTACCADGSIVSWNILTGDVATSKAPQGLQAVTLTTTSTTPGLLAVGDCDGQVARCNMPSSPSRCPTAWPMAASSLHRQHCVCPATQVAASSTFTKYCLQGTLLAHTACNHCSPPGMFCLHGHCVRTYVLQVLCLQYACMTERVGDRIIVVKL